jgi:hypothetical protein
MRPSALVLGLVFALSCWPLARAGPPAVAQSEINYLLGFVERSGCRFFRNGIGYDSQQAQAHLRSKYDYLAKRDLMQTAEDFIERVATKSSLSGMAYSIQCNGAPVVTSNQWLREALAHYRASAAHGADQR